MNLTQREDRRETREHRKMKYKNRRDLEEQKLNKTQQ